MKENNFKLNFKEAQVNFLDLSKLKYSYILRTIFI